MKFDSLLELTRDLPLFETGFLLAGDVDAADVRRQLSRWTRSGKLRQLRRGLYMLAAPYQKRAPHPFLIANALVPGSYISGQSALAFHGLIPEYAPRTLSVTRLRASRWPGGYLFHHLAARLFFGYELVELGGQQQVFVAAPEKALLDLAHLTPRLDSPEYLRELRLQNLARLDLARLHEFAGRSGKPKWKRVADRVASLALHEQEDYEELA